MVDRSGQQLGHYKLIRLIGRGGSADVYLARNLNLRSWCAIKILRTPLVRKERYKFLEEARLAATLKHNHLVRILDFGVPNDIPYIAMSYAPNGSLRNKHPRSTLVPFETILGYLKQIADALNYLHAQNLIHRDIKPENLLLGYNHEVLLSDFGISESVHKISRSRSGTLNYMAPEQLEGYASKASDQYSLAVVVYEWLSGELPFRDPVDSAQKKKYSWNDVLHPDIPYSIQQAILKALAKDPSDRYASITEFVNALQAAKEEKQNPIKKYQTEENKGHLKSKYKESAFHHTHQNILLQENDTFPILTNCLAGPYIEKAFEHLPWLERNCLLLYADAEFTQEDIAEILNLSKKAVYKYLVSASRLWLQAYNFLLKKDLDISLSTDAVSHHKDFSRVKRLIQSQNH